MNPIYSRRVRRVPPIVSLPSGGRRKQRGGIFPLMKLGAVVDKLSKKVIRKGLRYGRKKRRERVQKGGMILPSRTKLPDYSWVKNALKKQRRRKRR